MTLFGLNGVWQHNATPLHNGMDISGCCLGKFLMSATQQVPDFIRVAQPEWEKRMGVKYCRRMS